MTEDFNGFPGVDSWILVGKGAEAVSPASGPVVPWDKLSDLPANPETRRGFFIADLTEPRYLTTLSQCMEADSVAVVSYGTSVFGRAGEWLRLLAGRPRSGRMLVSGQRSSLQVLAREVGLDVVRTFTTGRRSGRESVLLRKSLGPSTLSSLSLVVPLRNEAGNIPLLFNALPALERLPSLELVFVEGGSTDNTWDLLQNHLRAYRGSVVLRAIRQTGTGKASAVRQGFDLCTGDLFGILDGDLTVSPRDIPRFWNAYRHGLGEVLLGSRLILPMQEGAMRPLNYLGNLFFARVLSAFTGYQISDALCGTKVLARSHFQEILEWNARNPVRDPFGDFDLIFGAKALGLRLAEIPISYSARVYGQTNISRFRNGLSLLQLAFQRRGL